MDVGGFLKDNWTVISTVPWVFVGWAILFGGIGLTIASLLSRSAHATKDERLKLAEERVSDYRDKLAGQSPEEVRSRIDALERQISAMAPQRLSLDARNAISATIKGQPKYVIEIAQDMAVAQAKPLANDFASVFQGAGWEVHMPSVMGVGNSPPSGIALNVIDPKTLRSAEALLKDALERAKIKFDIRIGLPARRSGGPGGCRIAPHIANRLTLLLE